MFLQVHTLTGYSSVLLNRDDSGFAKRVPFGDGIRTRVSSQSIKFFLRNSLQDVLSAHEGNDLQLSLRSRFTFLLRVARPLIAAGHNEDEVIAAVSTVMAAIFPAKKEKADKEAKNGEAKGNGTPAAGAQTAKKRGKKGVDAAQTAQLSLDTAVEDDAEAPEGDDEETEKKEVADDLPEGVRAKDKPLLRGEIFILSQPEIEHIKELCLRILRKDAEVAKELKAKPFAEKMQSIIRKSHDLALFGRFVTGEVLQEVDASFYVAHAMSTHVQHAELDFFTGMDSLAAEYEEAKADASLLGDTELTSPLLYSYSVGNWNQLLYNFQGEPKAKEASATLLSETVKLLAGYQGAKKGSTAPFSTSDFLLLEVGPEQPRSLAESYRSKGSPLLQGAVEQLAGYLSRKDAMYGPGATQRFVATTADLDALPEASRAALGAKGNLQATISSAMDVLKAQG